MILNKLFSFLINISVAILIYFMDVNLTNIPELELFTAQTLKLLVPTKKCKFSCKRTLYFTSNFRNNSDKLYRQYKIIKYKNKKNSFVTYYKDDYDYGQYESLLFRHGLIKSNSMISDNNFFFSKRVISLINTNNSQFKINNFQKFYRFFGYQVLFKDSLYMNYLEMKKKFNKDYDFMSETYIYPKDKDIIENKFINYTLNLSDLWLIKPKDRSGGYGIKILYSFEEVEKGEFLISKYIMPLDFINNKKYDLRLYVLVTGLKPLRIYLNKEGLIRIATNNFSLDEKTIKDKYIHLTNTGVNSRNSYFIKPNNTENQNANIWNLKTYAKYLKKKNVDYDKIKKKIKKIIIKSIISIYQNLTLEQRKNNLNDINFYDILGYDIIITNKYEPILIEINTGPSIVMYNELDKIIKTNLLVDTLNLIGISIFSKNIIFKKQYFTNISIEDNVNNALCELTRPRGDYELIFPLKSNIRTYKKFFKGINSKENELFWKKILSDD